MQRISARISETVRLADQLVEDIRKRNLKPGDTYFTTRDARQFLGVGGTAANRAMQLLEKRHIIKRTQRRGAIILSPPQASPSMISRIHILVPEHYYRTEGFGGDGVLFGVQSEFPSAIVSNCLLGRNNEAERVVSLVQKAIAEGGIDAFILSSAPFEVQRSIARTGFPAAVYGTAYRGVGYLPQVERDLRSGVIHLIHHFQRRGARRIATLLRQHVHAGDHQLFDTILSILGNAAPIRFLVSDFDHMVAETRNILRTEPSVDGFLCQSILHAEAVETALKLEGRSRDAFEIGVIFAHYRRDDPPRFTHTRMISTPEEIGQKLASILRECQLGEEPENVTIPVELVVV